MDNNKANTVFSNSSDALTFITLLAPAEILQELGTPEQIAAQTKHYSAQNSKNFFITKCLINTQTAGFAMRRWSEFSKTIMDEQHAGFKSLQLSAILTEQSAWQRKLAEILTLQICFSETNENIYYFHYLLVEDLARCLHQIKEQQEYFHSESEILNAESRSLLGRIREAEHTAGFHIARCWYLTEQSLISGRKGKIKPGSLTCSVGGLIKPALEKARKFEKRALGYTYYQAISSPSENIHFHPLPSSQKHDEPRFYFGLSQSGLLAVSIAARAQEMLNIFPTGRGSTSARSAVKNDPVRHAFSKDGDLGDFIIVDHAGEPYLGEIMNIKESKYGNASYEVEFLAEKPLQQISKDWIMASRCSKFMNRKQLEDQVSLTLRESAFGADEKIIRDVSEPANIKRAIRAAVCDVWNRAGIRNLLVKSNSLPEESSDLDENP